MAFSTATELQNNVKMIEATFVTSPTPTEFSDERIAFADKVVKIDCSNLIDFSQVPDDATTPVVNILSQYKAAELSLRRIAGIKRRQNENDDLSEWVKMYNDLKVKIAAGSVAVELADGTSVKKSVSTFRNTARPSIRPEQGYDKYGEWLNNTDMQELRGNPDDTKFT